MTATLTHAHSDPVFSEGTAWSPTVSPLPHVTEPSDPANAHANEHFPPWRTALEVALKDNERADSAHLYASLATIKPFGRPANRSVYFRGFLSDGLDSQPHRPNNNASNTHEHKHRHRYQRKDTVLTHESIERLSNVLMFVVDVRSGSVEDVIHGSKFGEVCWIFPETHEQIRLSGQLHLILSPTHPLSQTHQIPEPFASSSHFPHLDWEKTRLEMWRKISSLRRASFTWPTTRHVISDAGGHGFHSHGGPHAHESNHNHHHQQDQEEEEESAVHTCVLGGAISTAISSPKHKSGSLLTKIDVPESSSGSESGAHPQTGSAGLKQVHFTAEPLEMSQPSASPPRSEHSSSPTKQHKSTTGHDSATDLHFMETALNNFCILLLDVDGADHVKMQKAPHARVKYRRMVHAMDGAGSGAGCADGIVQVAERVFSVDDLVEGRLSSVDGIVRKVAHWSVKDVLG
ncbi:hypothetical protein CcCBS67573_g02225 [Chytriomyces confervae]|uniref:Pyridoxamine 5'-phosphate oxidase Alr4036 family FMN-binding domain-containing protein n=1 Tax=Chytriomyces confervae TaxID=246404 RepID=A0A507FM50_9FUNG|nr:hypothetical protein CcCBS67573_g02225 [Chytriomyces confervae]